MFWDKGLDDLAWRAGGGDKYRSAHRCVGYWTRLNPGYVVRVLDDTTAAELSPSYRALGLRHLPVQLRSDVLRLELLSLYGGVWADVTACPLQPLDSFVPEFTAPNGFFAWHGPWCAPAFAISRVHAYVHFTCMRMCMCNL